MTDFPYPIGTVVRGANCIGRPFEAEIVGYRGRLTPVLSDGYVTPLSLIHEVVKWPAAAPEAEPDCNEDPICGEVGRCDPADAAAEISSCRHCGKELRKRGDEWLTWDEDDRRAGDDQLAMF